MIGAPVSAADIAWTRQHFVDHVRASGPLPALRVGRQPYGILPATSLRLWQSALAPGEERTREERLTHFLLQLWDLWFQHVPEVPRVGRSAEPDRDFADVFASDGLSSSYAIRHLMGDQYLRQLWLYFVAGDLDNLDRWWAEQAKLARPGLARFGIGWDARLTNATYSGMHRVLRGTARAAGDPLRRCCRSTRTTSSCSSRATDLEQLRTGDFGDVEPRGLLYALLRHALLLGYWAAAASLRVRGVDSTTGPITPIEVEIVEAEALTAWRLLAEPVTAVSNEPVWTFLRGLDAPPADTDVAALVAPLLELRDSLQHLSGRQRGAARAPRRRNARSVLAPARRLGHVVRDARRLSELRAERPTGLVVGGYGWVVNLKPAPAPTPVTASVPGETGVVYSAAGNPGYTHTPSLAQAATAAVLRSGHLTHATSPDRRPPRRRPVLAARPPRHVAARRRAPGPAARRPARLSLRAPAAGARARRTSSPPSARSLRWSPTSCRARPSAPIGRSKPLPPTTSSTGSCCSASGERPARCRRCSPTLPVQPDAGAAGPVGTTRSSTS